MTRIYPLPGHDLIVADMVRAENCSLFDSKGKRYVDLESGVWCTSIGHAHPRMIRAVTEQLKRIAHTGFGYSSAVVEESAEEILSLLRFGGGKCVFLCSGSEAVEYSVRAARMLIERPLMMTMADSYFGAYGSASLRNEDEWHCFDWSGCAGCPDQKRCDEKCDRWAEIPFDRIGAFLFEPGSSSGLVRFPPLKLIRNIVRSVKEAGGLVLINEVTTGAGRTGKWFGYMHYEIEPDIVAMGKGISNGYPASVTAFAGGVAGRLGERSVAYAQSHQNDPLGASVILEVVRVIGEEGLIERGNEISGLLSAGLREIADRTGRIEAVRVRGLMVAVDLENESEAIGVHRELADRGFLVARRPGLNTLRIDPALTIERSDVLAFLKAFEHVLISR